MKIVFCCFFQDLFFLSEPFSSGKDSMIGVSAAETLPQKKRLGKPFQNNNKFVLSNYVNKDANYFGVRHCTLIRLFVPCLGIGIFSIAAVG